MKKTVKAPRVKVNPDTTAKNMKKELGEFDAKRVVKNMVSLNKNFSASDVNLKDFFTLEEIQRTHRFWEQVNNILNK